MTATNHGESIAIPAAGSRGKYAKLVAEGRLRLKAFTTDDIDQLPYFDPGDDDPVARLIAAREEEHAERTTVFRDLFGEPNDRDLCGHLRLDHASRRTRRHKRAAS